MLGISRIPLSMSIRAIRGRSVCILYKMRLLRLRLDRSPGFLGNQQTFLRRVSFRALAPSRWAATHRGLFHHPCFPRRNAYKMRTKCAQKRECHFFTHTLSTTYNFQPSKCTHFYEPPPTAAILNTDPLMTDYFRLPALRQLTAIFNRTRTEFLFGIRGGLGYRIGVISRSKLGVSFAPGCVWVVLGFLASATFSPAQIAINEVMANNKTVVANDGQYPGWVELINLTGAPVNIGDWSLSDSLASPRKFIFPSGTVVPANGYLGIWLDSETNSPGIHTGFSIKSRAGDDLTLYNASLSGSLQVDRIVYGIQPPDVSIGRVPNGTGAWVLTAPTFEFGNQSIPLGVAAPNNLRINEVMANPSGGEDWFELYNTTTNYIELSGLVFTDLASGATNRPVNGLSFIGPGGFLQLFASGEASATPDADQFDFKLNNTAEQVSLFQADRTTLIDRLTYTVPQTNSVSFGRLPDGGPTIVYFAVGRSTPEASNFQLITDVIINEVLAHTDPPLEDAIELYNPTAAPVNIGYWWLSNSKDDPKKFRIPANTIIPAGGYKVFYEWPGSTNGFNANGQGTNRSFTLNSARGDQVYLHTADAAGNLTFFRLSRDFGPSENGVSFGRYVKSDATTDFVPMSRHTFGVSNPTSQTQFRSGTGAQNAYPKMGPLVISEIMYHPPDVGTSNVDNSIDEYVEIFNLTTATVPLYDPVVYPFADGRTNTWRLRGVVDFNFPQNVTLAPGAYLLVVNFDPVTNPTQLAAFRSTYGVPPTAAVFGPYEGKLQNGSGDVELYKPDPPQAPDRPDAGLVPYILVEKVKYSDNAPWPVEPDGQGPALQRARLEEYGNDAINWVAAPPTPGRAQLPRIESVQRAGTQTTIQFTGAANTSYTLQSQVALGGDSGSGTNAWTTLGTVGPQPTTGLRQVTDSSGDPRRFYRLFTP
jgi:hypothetical protein